MRLARTLTSCLLLCALASPAAAEPARSLDALVPSSGSLALMLGSSPTGAELGTRSLGSPSASRNAGSEESELTVALERMWSQVRAFRRPGGAEVILRGHF